MRVKKKVREAGSRFWRAALAGVLALGLTPLPAFATELAPGEVDLAPQADAISVEGVMIGTANAAANPAPEILGLSNPNMRNAGEANATYEFFGNPDINENPSPFLQNYKNGNTPGIYIGAYQGNPMAFLNPYVPGGSDDLATNPQNAVWELMPSVIIGTGSDDFPESGEHDFYIDRGDADAVAQALGKDPNSYQPIAVTYNRRTLGDMIATMYRIAAAADEAKEADGTLSWRYEDPMEIAANYERYILGQKGLVLKAISEGKAQRQTIALVQSYDSAADAYTIIPEGVAETTATTNRYLEAVQGVTDNYFNTVGTAGAATATVNADQLKNNVDFIIVGGQVVDTNAVTAALGSDGLLDRAFFCVNWSNGASFGTVMNSVENAQNVGRILPCVYPSVLDQSDMIAYYYDTFYHVKDGKIADFMADKMDGVRNWNATDSAAYTTWETSDYTGYVRNDVQSRLQEGVEWLAENGGQLSYLVPTTHIVSNIKVPDPQAVEGLTYNPDKTQSGVVTTNGYIIENGKAKEPGTYTATVTLEEGYVWADGATGAKTVDYTISNAKVKPPTAITGLMYNGEEQTGVAAAKGFTVENGTATVPGNYTATATLEQYYEWVDGTTEPKQVDFSMMGDVTAITVNKFDASYAYTGDEITIKPSFKDGDIKFTLEEGTDYTIAVTQNGAPATLKELGTYQVTLTGIGLWTGTIEKTVKVVPFFTVYVKEAGGEATAAKTYNEGDFKALKSSSTDPVSALYNASATGWNVASTNNYVTFADLVADARANWGEGYMVSWEGKNGATTSYTFEELQATKFFPAAVGSGTHDTAGAVAAPLVFALTQGMSTVKSGTSGEPQDAAAAQTAALAAASANGCPRTIVGISEADYENPSADGAKTAGMRLWNNINAVTIIKMTAVDKPTAKTLTYNGSEQTGVVAAAGYTVSGNTATNAGSYTATATLEEGFVWSDGSTGPAEVAWTIKPASIAKASVTLAKKTATYTGKAQSTTVKTVALGGKTLVANTDYTAVAAKGTKAGKYTATVTGKGNYTGKATATFTINKAANTLKAKVVKATQTVKYGKATTIVAKKAFKVTKNASKGKVTYKKASGNAKIKIAKTGKVTVKKGLKRGTYKVKVKVTSAATANYKAASKTITLKVKVK